MKARETDTPKYRSKYRSKYSKTLWFFVLYVGGVVVVASISYTLRLLVI